MALPPIFDRLRLPVIGSPLFIVSGPELVIAQCKAGVVGSFPALNARPQALLDEWLHQITEELAAWDRDNPDRLSAPYAVNQIVHKSNDRLEQDIATCAKWKVPITITSLGAREELNQAVHSWGGITLHDIIDDRFARKAIEKGADGLIPVAAGAGGHAGRQSPFALVQEIREWFDGPIALSGAIGHGRSVLAAQACGADLAYIGTPPSSPPPKPMPTTDIRTALSKAAPATSSIRTCSPGCTAITCANRSSPPAWTPDNLPEGDLSTMNFGSGGNTKVKAWKDIWGSGQGIGSVRAVRPVADFVAELEAQYLAARRELEAKVRL